MSDDDPTRIIRRSGGGGSHPEGTRQPARGDGAKGGTTDPDDPEATRILDREETVIADEPKSGEPTATEPVTRLARPGGISGDYVRGWLVIVGGKGFGRSVEIGTGQNQIGRDRTNRISLPFGDGTISRQAHAVVTYDPKKRNFFLTNNQSGANLTYVNEDAVLAPVKLAAGDVIEIGDTKLRFVPLCCEDFDWSDVEEAKDEGEAKAAPAEPSPRQVVENNASDDDVTRLHRNG